MGIGLLISGVLAALISFEPSRILQYIFMSTALAIGILGILVGMDTKEKFIPTAYYSGIGIILIGLSVAVVIWGASLVALVHVLGFSLLLLGMVEFVFALQILNYQSPVPWKIVGLKLTLSATTAIGAASILTIAGFNMFTALLFIGVLFVTVGLTFIRSAVLERN